MTLRMLRILNLRRLGLSNLAVLRTDKGRTSFIRGTGHPIHKGLASLDTIRLDSSYLIIAEDLAALMTYKPAFVVIELRVYASAHFTVFILYRRFHVRLVHPRQRFLFGLNRRAMQLFQL